MEKRFFYTTITLIFLFLLIGCVNKHKSNLDEVNYYVENIQQIKDTLVKSKSYNIKLIVCTLKKTDGYNEITLSVPDATYFIDNDFRYKIINGMNIIFIDYDKKINDKELNDDKIKGLIEKKIISFKGNAKYLDYPFYKFIFCQKDFSCISCYDNIIQDKLAYDCMKNGKSFNEKMLYPKCCDFSKQK